MSMAAEARSLEARTASEAYLGADELLAGSAATYDIEVPAALIEAGRSGLAGRVQLRRSACAISSSSAAPRATATAWPAR